jgi:hypothetical protein
MSSLHGDPFTMSRKEVPRVGLVKAALAGKFTNQQDARALASACGSSSGLKARFRGEGMRGWCIGVGASPQHRGAPPSVAPSNIADTSWPTAPSVGRPSRATTPVTAGENSTRARSKGPGCRPTWRSPPGSALNDPCVVCNERGTQIRYNGFKPPLAFHRHYHDIWEEEAAKPDPAFNRHPGESVRARGASIAAITSAASSAFSRNLTITEAAGARVGYRSLSSSWSLSSRSRCS